MTDPALHGFEGLDIRFLIDGQASARADHPCLVWEPFEGPARCWSYTAFREEVRAVAAGLAGMGVRPGERVLVHLENCPAFLFTWLGAAYAGAVPVTTNTRSAADEVSYFARHSGAVGAVTQASFGEMVRAALPDTAWLFLTDDDGLEAGLRGEPGLLVERSADPMAPFAIQYTSGTSARPKAVVFTHANALWGGRVSAQHEGLRSDDVHLVHLPLFHVNAQVYSVMASLWAGATIVLQPRFSASRFWPVSLRHGCTWTSVVPFCIEALMQQPMPETHAYRHFGHGICAPPTDRQLRVKTIGWWGMTETVTHGIVGALTLPNAPMSMGRPAAEYRIVVLDENGRPVAPGGVGELFVGGRRGVSLFSHYLDDPDATNSAFTDDGLLRTGDRVRLGQDGSLFFADRMKDMLKVGGENVAASEIERVIVAVAGVAEVAVAAKRDAMRGELPVAFVIPTAAAPDDLVGRIAAECAAKLADFKRPAEIRLVAELPRAALNKVAKSQLRALLQAEADETMSRQSR